MVAGAALGAGPALLLARATVIATLLSLGGALLFGALVAPKALARMPRDDAGRVGRALAGWTWFVLGAAGAGLALWTLLQTAQFAGTSRIGDTLLELGPVLIGTVFGHVVLLQAMLLAATCVVMAARPRAHAAASCLALACVASEAGHGHAMAIGGPFSPLLGLNALHLVAASLWIGGLPPFLLIVWLTPPACGQIAARWFSPIGKIAVCALAASALLQAARLVGSPGALFATAYGWMVLAKTALFAGLLGLALLNRYVLATKLKGSLAGPARRRLMASVAVQSLLGLAAILAATVLSALPPGVAVYGASTAKFTDANANRLPWSLTLRSREPQQGPLRDFELRPTARDETKRRFHQGDDGKRGAALREKASQNQTT